LIISLPPTASSAKSCKPCLDSNIFSLSFIVKIIFKPGHKQEIVLKRFSTFEISTSVFVKNSSLGFQLTTVPFSFSHDPVALFAKTPSSKTIFSYFLSL